MRVLVTRPEPDAHDEVEELAARGHEGIVSPLLVIEQVKEVALDLDGAQALIVTSRNALRALSKHPALDAARALPLFAVGEATAQARARAWLCQGDRRTGERGRACRADRRQDRAISRQARPSRRRDSCLRPEIGVAGARLQRELQPVLYRAVPATELTAAALRSIKDGKLDGVILMSPRTAKTFLALLERHGTVTQAKRLVCYCISEAVAEMLAPLGFRVRVAAHKRAEDVLALLDSKAASS